MRWTDTLKRWAGRLKRPAEPMAGAAMVSAPAMFRLIEQTRDVEYSCDDVYGLLDQFAEAVFRGDDVTRLMPLVQHHLEMCADCREEFEALLRVLHSSAA